MKLARQAPSCRPTITTSGRALGVAYKLSPKMVIRGSYGEYFWTMPLSQILQASRTNPPFNLRYENPISTADGTGSYGVRTKPLDSYFIGKATIPTTGIVELPSSARGVVPMDWNNWRDGRAQSWHFTIEQELSNMTALRLSYIGNHSGGMEQKFSVGSREAEYNYVARTKLAPPANRDLLRVNKDWSPGNATNKTGYSNTNSLQAEIERRFSNGLAFQYFYTFTRSLTTSDAGGFESGGGAINSTNGVFQVPENIQLLGGGNLDYDQRLRLGYQNSTNIPPHRMRWNVVYDLPFGKGKKFGGDVDKAVDLLIGGWQVAGIGDWRSGQWMGVSSGLYLFGNPSLTADQRLDLKYAGRNQRLYWAGDFNPLLATNVDQAALQALVPLDRSKRHRSPGGRDFQQPTAAGSVQRHHPADEHHGDRQLERPRVLPRTRRVEHRHLDVQELLDHRECEAPLHGGLLQRVQSSDRRQSERVHRSAGPVHADQPTAHHPVLPAVKLVRPSCGGDSPQSPRLITPTS